jgi:Transposase DDE domain
MLIQERVSGPDSLLKLYVTIDDLLQQMHQGLRPKHLPRDPRGGQPQLSAAEVVTMLVWGAWRGLSDKAKLYYHLCEQHRAEFPGLGSYSKFVEATNRYTVELRGLLALILAHNRQVHQPYPVVFQDSTALPVCKVARASHHRTFQAWARKSKNGMGWWYGFKVHVQCDEEGRLCAFDLTTASVDDRRLLEPLTRWMATGIVVGDGGYLSEAKAYELGSRGVYLLTGIRKNMRKLASQFQLACLQARHRIEELFEFLKCSFGLVRSTHRASYALPIHLLVCFLAYSLYKQLIA